MKKLSESDSDGDPHPTHSTVSAAFTTAIDEPKAFKSCRVNWWCAQPLPASPAHLGGHPAAQVGLPRRALRGAQRAAAVPQRATAVADPAEEILQRHRWQLSKPPVVADTSQAFDKWGLPLQRKLTFLVSKASVFAVWSKWYAKLALVPALRLETAGATGQCTVTLSGQCTSSTAECRLDDAHNTDALARGNLSGGSNLECGGRR